MTNPVKHFWYWYKQFVERAIQGSATYSFEDITYWRERLFIQGVTYTLPFSLFALIPSLIITLKHGHLLIPFFDVFALVSLSFVVFNKGVNLFAKKAYVVGMFYLLSIVFTTDLGSFGIGAIYMLALSVFIALLFSQKTTYWSIVFNFLVYTGFSLIIAFKLFHSPLIVNYSLGYWIAYSANFLFLDTIVVILLCHVINWLESTCWKEVRLAQELKSEAEDNRRSHELLRESEGHYKILFVQNPSPMWIFDVETLEFLQVNEAAVRKYGYTEDEFMNLTIKDIRPAGTVDDLAETLSHTLQTRISSQLITQHRRKNGEEFYVDVRCSTIPFKGKEARLVIARNINSQIEHTRAIEKQNNRLREIAFMQSHVVRAPLARILGLTDLIAKDPYLKPDDSLIAYLDLSAKELDQVIREIVNNTEEAFAVIPKKDLVE